MTEPDNRFVRNRRYKIVGICVALVTAAFYTCLAVKAAPEWFEQYASFMTWAVIAAVAGLSATDAVTTWRNGGGK
jgi:high-affinity Fe2+/Pb2+ permease